MPGEFVPSSSKVLPNCSGVSYLFVFCLCPLFYLLFANTIKRKRNSEGHRGKESSSRMGSERKVEKKEISKKKGREKRSEGEKATWMEYETKYLGSNYLPSKNG